MSVRVTFDSLVASASGISARIGLFLATQAEDAKYALLPKSMFSSLSDHRVLCGDHVVGEWRLLDGHETSTELRRTCVLASFHREFFSTSDLRINGILAGSPCSMEEAFGRQVRIFAGSKEAVGKVVMAFRPISFAVPNEPNLLLRDTLAVRFERLSHGDLKLGRLVVTEDDKRPLGIILGGDASYCLLAPIQPFLSEARFRNALVEVPTLAVISVLRENEDRRLLSETTDPRWSAPVPEVA